jgi:hypothetical protein
MREQIRPPVRDADSSKSLALSCNNRNAARLAASSLDYHPFRVPLADLEGSIFVLADRACHERVRDMRDNIGKQIRHFRQQTLGGAISRSVFIS